MANRKIQLIALLRETVELLEAANERGWAFRLRGDLERLEDDDGSGLDHLLSAYGGMGSLNDLYLCAMNGHKVRDAEAKTLNARLNELTSEMWQVAKELSRAQHT